MPPRRRHHNPSAARLPASRLPLGTHLPGDDNNSLRPTSRNTDRSASSPRAAASDASDMATHIDIKNHPSYKAAPALDPSWWRKAPDNLPSSTDDEMDNPPPLLDSEPAHSLAEAKLRRQQERIQNAEAALAAPLHLDRREPSRGKTKTNWKPLDIEWDTAERAKNDSSIPVQTRTNTIYGPAFSRETSLSRSLSSISQQTTTTDADRHDSITDSAGFQTYHGRRGRKHPDELAPTEDNKQDERQATVEGSYDKREMCKVFGHELPSSDFISSNAGFKDGQLQFVQHPNGDVAAHMWSHNRYMWENIGNFSNIRKRIEGQLASDRLKGETGWQTLQKNTLAYFRAIAKQREQTTMGHEFGQAEIQQILPQPAETMKPPQAVRTESPATSTSSRRLSTARPPLFNPGQQQTISTSTQRPAAATAKGFPFLSNDPPAGKEDPFSTSGIFLPAKEPSQQKAALPATVQPAKSTNGSTTSSANPFLTAKPTVKSTNIETTASRPHLPRPQHGKTPSFSGLSGLFPLDTAKLSMMNISHHTERRQPSQASLASSGTPSRNKATTPLSTREAMRDQLWKVSEFAQQRTNSQSNFRTVLHDPFQNQSAKSEASRTEPFPDFDSRSDGESEFSYFSLELRSRRLKPQIPPSFRNWADVQPALNGVKPLPIPNRAPSFFTDSVPDTDDYARNTPSNLHDSTPLYLAEPEKTASTKKLSYDEELKQWWTSGNKFARQEDLYQRIKSLEQSRAAMRGSTSATTTPSSRPRPIGAPPSGQYSPPSTASPRKTNDGTFNKTITRALIPVYENLASYVQGPPEQRRDYWSPWTKAPEYAIDHSMNGNKSFYDDGWGQPPARIGRDPRYRPMPGELRFGGFSPGALGGSPRAGGFSGIPGLRGTLGFGSVGRY